mgnify:CR=1 FL=1
MSEKAAIRTLDYCSAPWLAGEIAAKDFGGTSVATTSPYNARQTVRDVSGLPLAFDGAMPVILVLALVFGIAMTIFAGLCILRGFSLTFL